MAALTKLAALGVTAALAATATGCGSRNGTDDAAAGSRGDSLVMGTTQSIVHLDPAGSYDLGSWMVIQGVYQSLLEFPVGSTTPKPAAAKTCSWQGRDHTVYTCTLRDGLTFSNGDKLTSKDVKYSFDRIKRINSDTGPLPLLTGLKKTDAPNADTVVFTLDAPDATFPSKLATGAGAIVDHAVFPADRLLSDGRVVGSGRYRVSGDSGDAVTLKPNGSYRGGTPAKNGGFTIRHYDRNEQVAAALRAGRIDMTDQLDPADVIKLRKDPGSLQLLDGPGTQTRVLAFNTEDDTTGKAAVRRAVAALVDRNALASTVYGGTVDPLYSLIPTGIAGHTTAFADTYPKPDAERARKLLKDAGLHLPVHVSYTWSNNPSGAAEAKEVKRQLESSGLFAVDVKELPWATFLKAQTKGTMQIYNIGWAPDFPDADNFTAPLLVGGGAYHTGWDDRKISRTLLPETQAEPDRVKAAEMFGEIDALAAKGVPMVPLWQNKQYIAAGGKIVNAGWTLDTTNTLRYWLISKGN